MASLTDVLKTINDVNVVSGRLDQWLMKEMMSRDNDRRWDVNSPSSMGGCERQLFYSRMGVKGNPDSDPRSKRILDNGTGVHERLEDYLLKAGIALVNEISICYEPWNIIGHADLLIALDDLGSVGYEVKGERDGFPILSSIKKVGDWTTCAIGEIKSINVRNFDNLKEAKDNHKVQAMSYMKGTEGRRQWLRRQFKKESNLVAYLNSEEFFDMLDELYGHLKDGSKFSREDKLRFRADCLRKRDIALWYTEEAIESMVFIYECKDDQRIKEFVVEHDDELENEVKEFALNVEHACKLGVKAKRALKLKLHKKPLTEKALVHALEKCAPQKGGNSKSEPVCAWCRYKAHCWVL